MLITVTSLTNTDQHTKLPTMPEISQLASQSINHSIEPDYHTVEMRASTVITFTHCTQLMAPSGEYEYEL